MRSRCGCGVCQRSDELERFRETKCHPLEPLQRLSREENGVKFSRAVARLCLRLRPLARCADDCAPEPMRKALSMPASSINVVYARRAHVRTDVQAHRARPMPWLPLCLRRWRRHTGGGEGGSKKSARLQLGEANAPSRNNGC